MIKWKLVWTESSLKDLKKMDKHIAKVIILKATNIVENSEINTDFMKPLKYSKQGHQRIRLGDYRVIYRIIHHECIVEAISIGHRKNIY